MTLLSLFVCIGMYRDDGRCGYGFSVPGTIYCLIIFNTFATETIVLIIKQLSKF